MSSRVPANTFEREKCVSFVDYILGELRVLEHALRHVSSHFVSCNLLVIGASRIAPLLRDFLVIETTSCIRHAV